MGANCPQWSRRRGGGSIVGKSFWSWARRIGLRKECGSMIHEAAANLGEVGMSTSTTRTGKTRGSGRGRVVDGVFV